MGWEAVVAWLQAKFAAGLQPSDVGAGTANSVLATNGSGVPGWRTIVNAMVDAAANIAVTKLAGGSASTVLQTNSGGSIVWATVTNAMLAGAIAVSKLTGGGNSTVLITDTGGNVGWTTVTPAMMAAQTFTSFTPALKATTTSGTHTYTTQVGRYVLIGKMLYFWLTITLSAKDATMSGTVYVDVPGGFTSINVAGLYTSVAVGNHVFNLSTGYTDVGAVIPPNDTRIFLQELGDNVLVQDITAAAVGGATRVWLSGCVPVQ